MNWPATRHEIRYGNRIVRAFAERPQNIDELLRRAAQHAGQKTALVAGDSRIDYATLEARVERLARHFVAHGLQPGQRIGLLLDNCPEFIVSLLAATRAGLVTVPMNTRQKRPEIAYVLNQCRMSALIFDPAYAPQLPDPLDVPELRLRFALAEHPGAESLHRLNATPAEPVEFVAADEQDPFCLLYTSGTTGQPKGAILSHFSTLHSVQVFVSAFGLRDSDAAMLSVPASHVTGLVAIILPMLAAGGTVVIMEAFKARHFLELAERERVSYSLMVPAMYKLCLMDPEFARFDLRSWRAAGYGGAPMPVATVEGIAAALPDLVLQNVYGATETTSPATIMPPGMVAQNPRTVGLPVAGCDILIVDDDGREVPPGETGELLIAGPMVVPGYWDNPEADTKNFINGYWRSGDLGCREADGLVYVYDRKKDMINRGGFKLYCIEVESVLSRHPSVIESAIIGVPCPVLGERSHAFIWADQHPRDAENIRAYCAERLSDYKVPDFVTFLENPLPRNANGKIQKTELRARLAAERPPA